MSCVVICRFVFTCVLSFLVTFPTGIAGEDGSSEDAHPKVTSDGEGVTTRSCEVLQRLLAGNQRFVEDHPDHPHERKSWRSTLSSEQHPVACILGCSDSRVPPELLFDQGFGDLFVVRVAGNVIDTDVTASIEYATDHLNVPLVVVMGHEGCGAVAAALASEDVINREPDEIHTLIDQIRPACCDAEGHRCSPATAVEQNVRQSVRQLSETDDLKHGLEAGHFRIVGAVYSLETGEVHLLDEQVESDLAHYRATHPVSGS